MCTNGQDGSRDLDPEHKGGGPKQKTGRSDRSMGHAWKFCGALGLRNAEMAERRLPESFEAALLQHVEKIGPLRLLAV